MNMSPTSPTSTKSVPATSAADIRPTAPETHKVQPGDSLASLAQTYYGGSKYAKFLADSNSQISDPAKLVPGTTVKIPALPADIDAKLSAGGPAKPAKPVAANSGGKRTYRVQPGDSFYRIAKDQLGNANRWKELFSLNKNVVHNDPTQLQVGQTLVLPD
jgi:nucleoid-associated protein YgaU